MQSALVVQLVLHAVVPQL
jgi:hypothetical protein